MLVVVVAIILAENVVHSVAAAMAASEFMNERPLRTRTSANGLPFSRGVPFTYFCRCDVTLAVENVADYCAQG